MGMSLRMGQVCTINGSKLERAELPKVRVVYNISVQKKITLNKYIRASKYILPLEYWAILNHINSSRLMKHY